VCWSLIIAECILLNVGTYFRKWTCDVSNIVWTNESWLWNLHTYSFEIPFRMTAEWHLTNEQQNPLRPSKMQSYKLWACEFSNVYNAKISQILFAFYLLVSLPICIYHIYTFDMFAFYSAKFAYLILTFGLSISSHYVHCFKVD